MAYYHDQCQYCGITTYKYDDGVNDGVIITSHNGDCGCNDQKREAAETEDFFDFFVD